MKRWGAVGKGWKGRGGRGGLDRGTEGEDGATGLPEVEAGFGEDDVEAFFNRLFTHNT
jgi:hypothetical protein